jgi:hypothetical protein
MDKWYFIENKYNPRFNFILLESEGKSYYSSIYASGSDCIATEWERMNLQYYFTNSNYYNVTELGSLEPDRPMTREDAKAFHPDAEVVGDGSTWQIVVPLPEKESTGLNFDVELLFGICLFINIVITIYLTIIRFLI